MKNILAKFTGATEVSDIEGKKVILNQQFCEMAKELLYGGYFLVDEKKKIYMDDIEFYYHEEGDGGLKDPIMYHTNDHEGKELPYYGLGRLNLHISGIDVTFENEEKHYRASFLIRGFHVNEGEYDDCSTHIYDELLYMGVPFDKSIEIEWINMDLPGKENYRPKEGERRYNVPAEEHFKINAKGKYEKYTQITTIPSLEAKEYFKASNKVYKRCDRPWRFYKPGLPMKKI